MYTTMSSIAIQIPMGTGEQPFEEVVERLRKTYLFDELPGESLIEVAARCRELSLQPGDTAVRQGDRGESLFVILSGRFEVVRTDETGRDVLLGELARGEYFGEGALLDATPRMATVRAKSSAELLVLDRSALDVFFALDPTHRECLRSGLDHRVKWAKARSMRPSVERVIAALGELTGGLDASALAQLEGEVEWVTLPRNMVLMRQGEPGDCLYLVVSGRLRVYGHLADGGEVQIGEIGPGESVGEMALLSNDPRTANVAAERDSELLRLSRSGFEHLVNDHPKTMGMFARVTVERLSRRIRARDVVSQLRGRPLVTAEECDQIAQTENLVLRNLKITQMYYRLSLQLSLMLGQQDANWCTFACNASKTAGYSIRRQELPFANLLAMLQDSPRGARLVELGERLLAWSSLQRRIDVILQAVSETISAGNLKVFAELAPIFARMSATFYKDSDYDRAKLQTFLDTLRRGPTEAGGQDTLAEALSHYYEAMFEHSPKRRTELILLGNIKVGLHEQVRLQPNIVDALDAPMRIGFDRIVAANMRLVPGLRTALQAAERELVVRACAVWRRLVTKNMMTLRLPYGDVRLGRDVPRLPKSRLLPDMLQELQHPELVRLARELGGEETGQRSRSASDWGDLGDRMSFILDLFRSRQKSLELFDQPFLYEQRLEMEANRLPAGRL